MNDQLLVRELLYRHALMAADCERLAARLDVLLDALITDADHGTICDLALSVARSLDEALDGR